MLKVKFIFKFTLLTFSLIFCFDKVHAQSISLQLNPYPFFKGGYSAEAGIRIENFKYSVRVLKIDEGEYLKKSSAISTESKVVGASFDYFVESIKGLYYGVAFNRVRWQFKHNTTGEKIRRDVELMGLRLGYQHLFSGGFFLEPRISYDYNTKTKKDLTLAADTIDIKERFITPAFIMGFQF